MKYSSYLCTQVQLTKGKQTRREPSSASEHMLHYFSSQDMMISHTLARRFFWSEYTLWKEDLEGLPLTVTLSGRDIVVPAEAVWNYLTDSMSDDARSKPGGTSEWQRDAWRVLWFDDLNHAGLLNSKGARRGVVQLVRQYCEGIQSAHTGDVNSYHDAAR